MKVATYLCIVPMSAGPSISRFMREIEAIVEASGLSATMHANGTSIEGELIAICRLAERCEDALDAMDVRNPSFVRSALKAVIVL